MKTSTIAYALTSLASLAFAAPTPGHDGGDYGCITQAEANTLVARYAAVISQQPCDLGTPTQCARAIAAPGYQEFSDSANTQIGIPLGAATASSKAVFISASQSNPPLDTQTLAVYASCNAVTWRWVSYDFGSAVYEVKGIHVFELASTTQIETTYFEFDVIAGALDTGYSVLQPNGQPLQVIPQSGS